MTPKTGKTKKADAEAMRQEVERLIRDFKKELRSRNLRRKVLNLIPVFHALRELGKALLPVEYASAARDRVLAYFCKFPNTVIDGDELLVVSGIQEYARRLRELRRQLGWSIASGVTIKEMKDEGEEIPDRLAQMKPSEYILLDTRQDRKAAYRWNMANTIRKEKIAVRDKILKFLLENVGEEVTGEELRYVAGDKTEWARRVRELRTEFGWPVVTKNTGQPNLGVGVYVMRSDRQSPEHDRRIPDALRREVLRRDGYKCKACGWSHGEWNESDPRHLELHHIRQHARGGKNVKENLKTLCTVCHDKVHRKKSSGRKPTRR